MVGVSVDFIGSRFGAEQQLEVIGVSDASFCTRETKYKVKCHVCSLDKELFGDAVFNYAKWQLNTGSIPCGCSNNTRWTDKQYTTKINRECDKRNYTFLGFIGDGKVSNRTKLRLKCNKDGTIWDSTKVSHFLNGTGCPECASVNIRDANRLDDELAISGFISAGFLDGTKFWRSERKGNSGHASYWHYTCPICSDDEYVQAGLCSGIFEAAGSNLIKGKKSCRCSNVYKWNQQQREYQVNKIIKGESLNYKFVGWQTHDGYKTSHSKVVINCDKHGDFPIDTNDFVNSGGRCPSCATFGFDRAKPSSLYILCVDGVTSSFTGYGITCDTKTRLSAHTSELRKSGFHIADSKIFSMSGVDAQRIELMIKRKFPIASQSVRGFVREATHSEFYYDVIRFVDMQLASTHIEPASQ